MAKQPPQDDAGADDLELHADELGDATGGDAGDADEAIDWRTRTDAERVSAIAELMREGAEEESDDDRSGDVAADEEAADEADADGEPETEKKRRPQDFDEIAETLGVEVADLWSTAFRDASGKKRTLGELKDLLAKDTDLETREHQFNERKVATENQLLRARQDLDFIVSQMPEGSLKKSIVSRAQAERERDRVIGEARTLEVIPEWRNETVRDKDRAALSAYLEEYGFDSAALDRVTDFRLVKLLRDSWQRAERVKKALERVEERGKNKGVGKPPAKRAASPRRASAVDWTSPKKAKLAAVTDLLVKGDKRR
jgi:hypothetical protein